MQVFERARLDAQLQAAACAFVRDSVQVCASRGATTVALPRVCQWYARDFSSSGSPLECAQAVAAYLEGEQRACLDACLKAATSGQPLSVLFLPFDFACRPLSLLTDTDTDADADADAARCTFRLRLLLLSGAPLLLPFGLVVAGRFQESRGRRLLWFLRHSGCVSHLVVATGLLSGVWLALGGAWLFGATCEAVARDAWSGAVPPPTATADTTLYDSALGAWALLLLLNTPWLLLPVTALLLLCRCPLAFSLIACLSGAQGGTMQL